MWTPQIHIFVPNVVDCCPLSPFFVRCSSQSHIACLYFRFDSTKNTFEWKTAKVNTVQFSQTETTNPNWTVQANVNASASASMCNFWRRNEKRQTFSAIEFIRQRNHWTLFIHSFYCILNLLYRLCVSYSSKFHSLRLTIDVCTACVHVSVLFISI